MKNVYFLAASIRYKSDKEINCILEDKIRGYKGQDRLKRRRWEAADYVTIQWIRDAYKACEGRCAYCSCFMSFFKWCRNQLTVDRIDDQISHIKVNCRLCCLDCNRKRENLRC